MMFEKEIERKLLFKPQTRLGKRKLLIKLTAHSARINTREAHESFWRFFVLPKSVKNDDTFHLPGIEKSNVRFHFTSVLCNHFPRTK